MGSIKTILCVGGTGAQGAAVVRVLSATGKYKILILTRDAKSLQCEALLKLGNVEAVISRTEHGYDLAAFESAARQSYGVFLNTDGFALGEQAETYWGIRLYETAVMAGVQHVIYSGLDDCFRNSGYNPHLYVAHFQGKSRVQAFIQAQPRSKTAWTITRTGPYIEMLSASMAPSQDSQGRYIFEYPLESGSVAFIHLHDYGRYVDWIFENPVRSAGLDLGISIAHISGKDIANAFTLTTKKPSAYNSISASDWCKALFSALPNGADTKIGFRSVKDLSVLNMTYAENFTNFWNLFKASDGNKGLIQRDYKLLDEILPDRIRSVQEWMERTGYTAEHKSLLKNSVAVRSKDPAPSTS